MSGVKPLNPTPLLIGYRLFSLCSDFLSEACKSRNFMDIHTAQLVSILINGPPDDSNEDTFVHYYLHSLLSSVFSSDPLLKMKWANGQSIKNNSNEDRPDFLVFNVSGSVKRIIVIAEFKPAEQNSYVESDLVKLAKQMKRKLNALFVKGVANPRVCGIHCEDENISTYIMDLPSPQSYRFMNASGFKLF